MTIIFKKHEKIKSPYDNENRIELTPDTSWDSKNRYPWDDFGYATTFSTVLFLDEKEYSLSNLKILTDINDSTHEYFKEKLKEIEKSYLLFPLDCKYVTLPTDIEFYDALKSLFSKKIVIDILKDLSDAGLVKNTQFFEDRKVLLKYEGFKKSLLREMTSRKAFENGWETIKDEIIEKDLSFIINFNLHTFTNKHQIEINMKKSMYPNNINILIGSNGTGKSQTLSYLIDELLNINNKDIDNIPVFNQIVTIAYSPFENFKTTLDHEKLNIKSSYKYFGFRNKEMQFNVNQPNIDSSNSIFTMLSEDEEKDYLKSRINKYDTFLNVLKKAIDFDFIAFELSTEDLLADSEFEYEEKNYVEMETESFVQYIDEYHNDIIKEEGIKFFKNDTLLPLSSGQVIFVQLISNIIGSIRQDTIILIDEPELYLHPNLEVELIDLLKELLNIYNSYAIIATHSAILTREVPKDYITILKKLKDTNSISITRPPFETIGANLERINSYVFFDNTIKKPYEDWLQKLVNENGSAEEVISKYKSELNEESLILLHGMEPNNGN